MYFTNHYDTNENLENTKDIHFLFETTKWNGNNIEDMSNSHIINTLLMLRRKSTNYKINYELFIIDNMNNKLLVPADDIDSISKENALTWIETTPLYNSLINELKTRNLYNYFVNVLGRFNENEDVENK